MKKKELLKKIEDLEERVAELERRPLATITYPVAPSPGFDTPRQYGGGTWWTIDPVVESGEFRSSPFEFDPTASTSFGPLGPPGS